MATRKFKITYMAHILFLSDSTVPEDHIRAKDGIFPIRNRRAKIDAKCKTKFDYLSTDRLLQDLREAYIRP